MQNFNPMVRDSDFSFDFGREGIIEGKLNQNHLEGGLVLGTSKHTIGIGSKFLMHMGYHGQGIGKRRYGIINPIISTP